MHRNTFRSVEVYCGKIQDKAYPCLSHTVTDLLRRCFGHGDDTYTYIILPAEALQLVDMSDGLAVYSASNPVLITVKAADYIEAVSLKAVILQHSPAEVAHSCNNYSVMVFKSKESADIAHKLRGHISHLRSAAAAYGSKILSDLYIVQPESLCDSRCGDITLLSLLGERHEIIEIYRQS